jgi:hypothetical protein
MNPPKIFISATSGDLSSARQIAKEALLTINCHPVEQTNFEPDWRSVTDMLLGKVGDCQALIHLVGFRYGASLACSQCSVASSSSSARHKSARSINAFIKLSNPCSPAWRQPSGIK